MRKRGPTRTIGIISAALLSLDPEIRYLPEYIYIGAIIPGPHEAKHGEHDYFIRPIIEQFVEAWKTGFRYSHTAEKRDNPTTFRSAILLSVNDLPAARKLAGLQGTALLKFICSICPLAGKQSIFRCDHEAWGRRDCREMKEMAFKWKESRSHRERVQISQTYGVEWSSLWLLDYWDPTRMLVIDSMHCVLEGVVHYHCRHLLRLSVSARKKKFTKKGLRYALDFPWEPYSAELADNLDAVVPPEEVLRVGKVQDILCLALRGERSISLKDMFMRVRSNSTYKGLRFVVSSLEIQLNDRISERVQNLYQNITQKQFSGQRKDKTKDILISLLLDWVSVSC